MSFDFEAEVRITTAFAKIRPQWPWRVALTFQDYPGVDTRAEVHSIDEASGSVVQIRMLAQQFFAGRLSPEMTFVCTQAGESIAKGVLTKVLNEALQRGADIHPASLNLHRYPSDISARIEEEYGVRASIVRHALQVLIGERPDCRHPRIMRAIIVQGGGDIDALEDAIELARTDYRDLLVAAECAPDAVGEPRQVRDCTLPFGQQ